MYDINDIVDMIANECDSSYGTISIEENDNNGNTLIVSGRYEIERYQEDDYFNGTGAWVTTDAEIEISELDYYDEDGEPIELDINVYELERKVRNELIKFR